MNNNLISLIGIPFIVISLFLYYKFRKSLIEKKIYKEFSNRNLVSVPTNNSTITGESYSTVGRLTEEEKQNIINNPQWDKIEITRNIKAYEYPERLVKYISMLLKNDLDKLGFIYYSWYVIDYNDMDYPETIKIVFIKNNLKNFSKNC